MKIRIKIWARAFSLTLLFSLFQPLLALPLLSSIADPFAISQQAQYMQRLEAGYLSNFPAYVKWPDDVMDLHPDTLYIGLIGADPLGRAGRAYLEGRFFGHLDFVVDWIGGEPAIDMLLRYQILYIGEMNQQQVHQLLNLLRGHPVLTVSRLKGFLGEGGCIQFLVVDDAITFDVSVPNAEDNHLAIDPRLIIYGQTM